MHELWQAAAETFGAQRRRASPSQSPTLGSRPDRSLVHDQASPEHLANLRRLAGISLAPPEPATNLDQVYDVLRAPEVAYFFCHNRTEDGTSSLYVGRKPDGGMLSTYELSEWALAALPIGPNVNAWRRTKPLVVINACHSADLQPGQAISFVSGFTQLGAAAIVGTEVAVQADFAAAFGETFLRLIAGPSPPTIGEAL
jgi:CHAT domain